MKYFKHSFKFNKKGINFLSIISIIGFIFGSIFLLIITNSDKTLVKEYISNFIKTTNNIKYIPILINNLSSNLLFILIVWILGISIIGIPINIFYLFFKSFTIGFTLTSFILTYKFKGLLLGFFYLIPHNLINILTYIVLTYYSINFSFKLIYIIFKKENINIKPVINRYFKILLFSVIIIFITSLYESFILPNIFNKIIRILHI